MKITYNQNPLRTTVELDERERKELWYKIKIDMMEHIIHGAWMHLDKADKQMFDLKKARAELNPKQLYNQHGNHSTDADRSELDLQIDRWLASALDDLMDIHLGDCTCVACSCGKCRAESWLGIDTTKGLGKHEGHQIDAAFAGGRSLEGAIEWLANYDPDSNAGPDSWKHRNPEMWASSVPRWKAEAARAYEWLVAYRDEHFPVRELSHVE